MRAPGNNDERRRSGREAAPLDEQGRPAGDDLVFDFAGLHRPDIADLSLVLTARLQSGAGERVWARELPGITWRILHALGLDHLFHRYPRPGVFN